MLKILFCDNDRIKVELEGNETKQYLLRPYNISDEKFSEELTTIEVELDSWGTVYLAYGNYASRHSIPRVMLINNQGDILYIFSGNYQHGSMVCDVVIEDIDGDRLKDIRVTLLWIKRIQCLCLRHTSTRRKVDCFILNRTRYL